MLPGPMSQQYGTRTEGSTTVAKRVGYDLRHLLYHHIQRLSLAQNNEARTGDLITRVTSDIVMDALTNGVVHVDQAAQGRAGEGPTG